MRKLRKCFSIMAVFSLLIFSIGLLINTMIDITQAGTTNFDAMDLTPTENDANVLVLRNTSGVAKFTVDNAGAVTQAGASALTGNLTITGNIDQTATATSGYAVDVDGSTVTTGDIMKITLDQSVMTTGAAFRIYENDDAITMMFVDEDELYVTPDATKTFNILTGNLKVGNDTPDVALDGEDAYIEGALEVDGAVQFDGNLAVNGGTLSATADLIIDPAGNDVDFDAADVQIDAAKKLSLNGATETDYIQSNTNVEVVAAADILLDPAGGDIDCDAADLQLDAGKKLSLNGSTETDYIYSSTDVEVGAAADIVLSPTGGQVDINGADVGLDAGKYLGFAGIAQLNTAALIYQNSAIEVFVNGVNQTDFDISGITSTGIYGTAFDTNGAITMHIGETFASAISLDESTTVPTGKTLNSVDNGGITLNGKIPTISQETAAQAIYSSVDTMAAGTFTCTFPTAFSSIPAVTATAIGVANSIYAVSVSESAVTFGTWTADVTGVIDGSPTAQISYTARGAR